MSESVLADDLHIKGEITTSGDIELKGSVEGEVTCRTLLIAEDAKVEGKVTAEKVVVRGTVNGQINGIRVTLSASSRVTGELMCKALSVDEEAYFDGTSQRVNDPLSLNLDNTRSPSPDLGKAETVSSTSSLSKNDGLKSDKRQSDKLQPLGAGSAS
jgi:cytoskeletal protein CcmA (bactofilin family)